MEHQSVKPSRERVEKKVAMKKFMAWLAIFLLLSRIYKPLQYLWLLIVFWMFIPERHD